MADFIGCTRTNYFRVKDEKSFLEIMDRAVSDSDSIEVWEEADENDGKVFAFGLFGSIIGLRPQDANKGDAPLERGEFFAKLQTVVEDGDAIIFTEAGHENLRYIGAWATVITSSDIKYVSLEAASLKLAKETLGNPDWYTQNNY